MQIEFLKKLEIVLLSFEIDSANLISAGIAKCVINAQSDYSQVRLQPTPSEIVEPYSCNIAFVLSSQYKRYFGEEVLPLEFARCILERWDKVGYRADFMLDVSSAGHLNFIGTPEFEYRLLREMNLVSAERIFESALVGESLFDKTNLEQRGAELVRSIFKLEIGTARTGGDSSDRYARFIPHGPRDESKEFLFARAQASAEARKVLACNTSKAKLDDDSQFMLLGLLANAELDARPFIEGEYSRQNIPWYLRRFRKDFSAWSKKVGSFVRAKDEFEIRSSLSTTQETERIKLLLHSLSSQILAVRAEYRQLLLSDRPEKMLGYAVDLIQSFYSIYNRPQAREVSYYRDPNLTGVQFYSYMNLAAKLIWFFIGATRAHCKEVFVSSGESDDPKFGCRRI